MRQFLIVAVAAAGLAAGVIGCDNSSKDTAAATKTETAQAAEPLPASLIATTQPTGPTQDVAAAKKSAKEGENVVVRGRIGAQKEPLAANRAIMTIADVSLPTCDKTPMKACKTPWDSCCEPQEELTAKSATVRVMGQDGRPLRSTLDGVGGMKPGKEVVVSGVARIPPGGGDALVIEANQIYVTP
jgi:hypothetical protein